VRDKPAANYYIKQPLWKRFLSYFFELHIESAPSEHNPHLYVSLSRGRYQLCTANAVYSFEDLYDNYVKTFRRLDLERLNPKRVLLLGLGLGSIPVMLEKLFEKHYSYTAIEIDESVIYLAGKYALPFLQSPVETICADAYFFVMQCEEKYDLICMDIFQDDKVPEAFEKKEFLDQLKALLSQDGLLLYNRLSATKEDTLETRKFFEGDFKTVFKQGLDLDVGNNWMLLNRVDFLKP